MSFNSYSMVANIYIYMDGYRPPSATIELIKVYIVYIMFYVASLRSAQMHVIFTQFTLLFARHEPVMLLMLHAVSLDRSMKIVPKEGEGITIK